MSTLWPSHRFLCISAALLASALPAVCQRTGSSTNTGSTTGSTGTTGSLGGSTSTRGITNTGNNTYNSSTGTPGGNTREIFLSGRVMFDDGSPANTDVRIERVCSSGSPHLEAHADSKGRFYFQIGSNTSVDTDAADASAGSRSGQATGTFAGTRGGSSSGSAGGFGGNPLMNCDLRASYPGFRSDTISLATRRTMDEPDVGTIVLHRLGNVKGTTISMTTALAPKRAVKAYEKGMQATQKGNNEEAEKHLIEATNEYPQYAVAWFALGELQQNSNRLPEAQKSYEAAIAADPKYVSPYDHLSRLFGQLEKWQEAADLSRQALDLNPVEFPSSYWYSAVANYNLKRPAEAEKSLLALVKVDGGRRYPQAEMMLSSLYSEKGQYSEAAAHLRTYLALQPGAKNADSLKQQLAALEKASTQPK